jgi:hypothetical protein
MILKSQNLENDALGNPSRYFFLFNHSGTKVSVCADWRRGHAIATVEGTAYEFDLPLTLTAGEAQALAEGCYKQWQQDRKERKDAGRAAFGERAS